MCRWGWRVRRGRSRWPRTRPRRGGGEGMPGFDFRPVDPYLKRELTCPLASERLLGSFLPDRTASMAGFMMPSTFAALSAMGNRKVVPSLTCCVNAVTSMPLALNAAAALSEELLRAGKTTALDATTSWHAGDARYSTHFSEGTGDLVAANVELA